MKGELTKMTLTGYKKTSYGKADEIGTYTANVNPESYTLNYEILRNQEQASGKDANPQIFNKVLPRKLSFDFLFDATGALESQLVVVPIGGLNLGGKKTLAEQIKQFKQVVFDFIGDTHEPPFVLLEWGNLHFKCKAEKLEIAYKLFKPDGVPLRAVAKVSFVEEVIDEKRAAEVKPSSPDMTHIRTVRAGDTLPLLCHDIYGRSDMYREVARVNKLTQFRRLQVGRELFFPPMAKVNN